MPFSISRYFHLFILSMNQLYGSFPGKYMATDAGKYMTGFKTVAAMVKAMDEELGITVPVALHLDHGTYEGCYKCIKAGFTSIMFDGSHYPFEENLAKSTELVNVAHNLGLSIECEVGSIGGESDSCNKQTPEDTSADWSR